MFVFQQAINVGIKIWHQQKSKAIFILTVPIFNFQICTGTLLLYGYNVYKRAEWLGLLPRNL